MIRPARRLAMGLLCAVLLAAGGLGALPEGGSGFRFERPVVPGAAGPNRLEPDVALLAGADPLRYENEEPDLGQPRGGLADLRFFDAAGREVPYLLVPPAGRQPEWRPGRLLPIASTRQESGFEVDLGAAVPIDRLRLAGVPAPFLKRFRLEGGGDRSRWTLLRGEGTLFDLPGEELRLTEAEFPAGEYRYLRLTWDDRSSGRLPLPGAVEARLARPVDPSAPTRVALTFERRESEPGKSRFRLRLPGARLPVVALELAVGGEHLLRRAAVTEGRLAGGEIVPVLLGEGTLRRAVRGDLAAADLRVPIAPPAGPDLELTVEDGDNPPLDLTRVTAELAPLPWIYFEAAGTGPLTARFGEPAAEAPSYDLEAVRGSLAQAHPALAQWGPVRDAQAAAAAAAEGLIPTIPTTGAQLDPRGFAHARPIPGAQAPGAKAPGRPPGLTSLLLDAAVLAESPGLADLRIVDAAGHQVPYLLEKRGEPLALTLPALQRDAGKNLGSLSRYPLQLPYDSLPEARLVLTTSARVFERQVRLMRPAPPESGRTRRRQGIETGESTLAEAAWRHADPETAAPALTLDLPSLAPGRLDLLIDEGDNTPLPLAPPRLLLPAVRLRFFHPGGELKLLYGKPGLAAPRYDLSLLAARLLGEAAHEAALDPEPGVGRAADPSAFPRQAFWALLVLAVVALLLVLGRLLKEKEPAPPPPAAP